MKESFKAKRIKRHQRRSKSQSKLNLVSLMDIFTILVFFLMVNSASDVQVLNQNESIVLPVSNVKKIPEDALAITVTSSSVLVAGREILTRAELIASPDDIEPNLKKELQYQASKVHNGIGNRRNSVIVVADRSLKYEALKKIMATSVGAGYSIISLAVDGKGEN